MPRTFNDLTKRVWSIDLNIGTVLRLKASGFNLLAPNEPSAPGESPFYIALLNDDEKLAALLWKLLEPQAVTAGLGYDEFLNSLNAAILTTAWECLDAEWRDFFRQRQKPHLEQVIVAMNRMFTEQMSLAETQAKGLTLEELNEIAKRSNGNERFGELPGTSASIPDSSASDNSAGCPKEGTEADGIIPLNSSARFTMGQ